MLDSVKKPWQSKTMILSAVMGVLAAVAQFVPQAAPLAAWIKEHDLAIGMVWGVVAMALRFITKDKIILVD